LESQINVLFLSPSGRYKGHLWSKESSNFNIELLQFQYHSDRQFQVNTSKAIVWGKLMNSKQLLLRLNRKRNILAVQKVISGINSDLQAVESVDNIDSLRGYEGISAARYFPALGQLITSPEFEFSQRHRQPPTDPVNALLSFGYTLLFNNVLSLIIAEGLSPYFGNFHYGEKKKPYLAFDLMEEFRSPIVDSLVLTLVNKSLLKSKHFEDLTAEQGIYLTESGRRIFFNQFENRMNEKTTHPEIPSQITYREAIQLQIRLYKRSLLSSMPYKSFLRSL
jgi:CRISPR-associated protein Cas1